MQSNLKNKFFAFSLVAMVVAFPVNMWLQDVDFDMRNMKGI